MKIRIFLFILPLLIFSFLSPAYADLWRSFPQVACIPAMDYFYVRNITLEATNDVFDNGYPEDSYEKYGVLMEPSIKNGQCKMTNGMLEYELEFFPDPLLTRISGCGFSGLVSGSHLKLWIVEDGKKTLVFDDSVTWHCNLYGAELYEIEYHSGQFGFLWLDGENNNQIARGLNYLDYNSSDFKPVKNDIITQKIEDMMNE